MLFGGLFAAWFLALCLGPDPRPLGAPDWAVALAGRASGAGEAASRVIATVALRAGGAALLGVLWMLAIGGRNWGLRSSIAILLAPALAISAQWINLGYVPIAAQMQILAASAALGALAGAALQRRRLAALTVVAATAGLFLWGTATSIDDDLDAATRTVANQLLARAPEVPPGEAGFLRMLELAFGFAEDGAPEADPVLHNKAAILALGLILGEEKLAEVARRGFDRSRLPELEALRARVGLYGRGDWPRHFFVSASLTLLSDANRSIAVGITKELMDATPGGSGFSFTDIAADAAGNRFALAATRDEASARAMQRRIRQAALVSDFLPDVSDLPEGISREKFQAQYGGLGGEGTQRVVAEIERRLATCAALQ